MNPEMITDFEAMIHNGSLTMEKLQEIGVIGQSQLNGLKKIEDNTSEMNSLLNIIIELVAKKPDNNVDVKSIDAIETIAIKGKDGDKGDKGDIPEKGKDYFTQEEIESFLKEITPKKGIDYFDGEKGERGDTGKPGKKGDKGDPGEKGEDGKDGDDGKDGSPDTPIQIVEKLKKLKKGTRLSFEKDLDDVPNIQDEIKKAVSRATGLNIKYLKDLGDIDIVGQINDNTTDGWVLTWDFKKTKFVLAPGGSGVKTSSTTSTATLTPSNATATNYYLTAQEESLTIANPTLDVGQRIVIWIKDDGTARAISFGSGYKVFVGNPLPTTTVVGKWMQIIIDKVDTNVVFVSHTVEA